MDKNTEIIHYTEKAIEHFRNPLAKIAACRFIAGGKEVPDEPDPGP